MSTAAAQNGQPDPAGNGKPWRFAWDARLLAALAEGSINATDFTVLSVLASHADYGTGRNARPGVKLLAERTRLSEPTVKRSLRRGVDARLAVQTSRGGGTGDFARASTYAMLPDATQLTHDLSSGPNSDHPRAEFGNSDQNSYQNSYQNSDHPRPPTEHTKPTETTSKDLPPRSSVASLLTSGPPHEISTTNDESDETPEHPSPSVAVLKDAGKDEERGDSPTVRRPPSVRLAAELLGLSVLDPLLDYVEELLDDNEAESNEWLRECHANGDLARSLRAYAEEDQLLDDYFAGEAARQAVVEAEPETPDVPAEQAPEPVEPFVAPSPEAEAFAEEHQRAALAGRRHRKRPPPEREETCCCRKCGLPLPVERCAAGCCAEHAS